MTEFEIVWALLRIEFCFDDLIVLLLFEPVPQKPNDYSEDEDAKKDNHPGELIREEISSFFKNPVFSVDILAICRGYRGVRGDIEERAHCDIFKRV